jgi:hypothetical protein
VVVKQTSGLLYAERCSNIKYIERETESSIKNPAISMAHVGAAYVSIKGERSPRLTLMEADDTLLTSYALNPQHHKTKHSLED